MFDAGEGAGFGQELLDGGLFLRVGLDDLTATGR
jgi:hypothetical protein